MFGMALVVGLFGVCLTALMVDDSDDASETTEPEVLPDPEDGTGEDLLYNGDDTITGTDGNDTLRADNQDHTADSADVIDLLGGDDVAEITTPLGTTLNGGEGDDTLTSTAVGNTLNGDAGDDVISAIAANDVFGGAGNDTITYDLSADLNDSLGTLDAGEGDDEITVRADISEAVPDFSSVAVTGGEGADNFRAVLGLGADEFSTDDPTEIENETGIVIRDFTPGEDTLTVEIDREAGSEARDMLSVELVTSGVGDALSTELTIVFAGNETEPQVTTTIDLGSATGITLDDIVFVQN